jgi:hypothetical protein
MLLTVPWKNVATVLGLEVNQILELWSWNEYAWVKQTVGTQEVQKIHQWHLP